MGKNKPPELVIYILPLLPPHLRARPQVEPSHSYPMQREVL